MKTNLFGGACTVCGEEVPARAGSLSGPPWKIKCLPCAGEVGNAPAFIKVERVGNEVTFDATERLGDRFNAFVTAVRSGGARFDGVNRRNVARMDQAMACIAALEQAGFTLEIHPAVSATLQAFAAQQKAAIDGVSTRATKVDEELRKRGLALYPFERIGSEWLAERSCALLGDDRGLGKTIQTLIALPEGAAVLVVCPQVAVGVWTDETAGWRPDLTASTVGTKDFHWPAAGEMVICTYGALPKVEEIEALGPMTSGLIVVADEAQAIKDPKSKRTQRFREVSHRARRNGGRVWLLSGSPLLNDPNELWAILQAANLGVEAFGSYWNFCAGFNATQDYWGKTIFGEAKPEVAEKLRRVMLRRLKADVLPELPELTFEVVRVDIGDRFEAELERYSKELAIHIPSVYDWMRAGPEAWEEGAPKPGATRPDAAVTGEEIRNARNILRSSSGASFHAISHMRELLAKAKIPALLNIVTEFEANNEPVLVFSEHRSPIDQLGTREGWATITGDHDGEERQAIARDFQDGKYRGLALTIDAGGTALTLTRSARVVFVDRAFTPGLNDQAIDRARRIGQTRGVIVTDLVANHYLDRRLAEILDLKKRIIQSSVEAASIKGAERPESPAGALKVDFAKLEAEALAKRQGFDAARAEAERIAAERAKNAAELRAKLAKEAEERKIREKGQKRYEAARQRAIARGWIERADHPERRPPQGPVEEWAADGLATLSGLDPDRARDRNDVGFNKSDSYLGHWLTVEIGLGGLTPNQWAMAIKLCRPYRRQIGECPKRQWPSSDEGVTIVTEERQIEDSCLAKTV